MKSNTTGSSVKVSKKQASAKRLEQAVCRTLEVLEGRVLMAAGWADQSVYDPNTNLFSTLTPTLTTPFSNARGFIQEDTNWQYFSSQINVYAPYDATAIQAPSEATDLDLLSNAPYVNLMQPVGSEIVNTGIANTPIENRIIKVLTDDAGKIYVVGTRVTYRGFQASFTMDKVTDPNDATKTVDGVEMHFYGSIAREEMYIARYLPNGTLETTFVIGDYAMYNDQGTYDFGNIGKYDRSKGGDAKVMTDFTKLIHSQDASNNRTLRALNNQEPVAAAIDPIDKSLVVIFGKRRANPQQGLLDYFVGRYYADGLGLGHAGTNDGMVPLTFYFTSSQGAGSTLNGTVRDMRMLSDGSFVLAGTTSPVSDVTTGQDVVLYRYTVNRGNNAVTAIPFATRTQPFSSYSADVFNAVDVDAQNRVYVVGTSDDTTWDGINGHSHLVIQRYLQTGELDATFGNNAKVELADFGSKNATGIDIKVQPDGRVVVMGQLDAIPDTGNMLDTTVVARFNSNGSLDTTFIGGGRAYILPVGSFEWLGQSLALQSDGGIVVEGEADGGEIQVTRLTKSGRTDTNFGTSGFGFVPLIDSFVSFSVGPDNMFGTPKPTITVDRGPTGIGDDKIIFGWTPAGDAYFDVERLLTNNKAPATNLQAPDVYTYNPAIGYTFVVTYTDDELVSGLSLGAIGQVIPGLVVYGPNGNPLIGASVTVSNIVYTSQPQFDLNADGVDDGASITVQYTVDLRNGGLGDPVNGLYSIGIKANTVSDTDSLSPLGNLARTLGGFRVNIAAPDVTPPNFDFNYKDATNTNQNDVAKGIVIGGASFWDFHVVYTDASGVDLATISDLNLEVTGPRGYDQMATVVGTPTPIMLGNGDTGFVVVYRILAPQATSANDPAHTWTVSADGIYHITMGLPGQQTQVADMAPDPNFMAQGEIGQFNVAVSGEVDNNVPGAVDTAPPVATLQPLAKLDPNNPKYDFTVVYTDATAVDPASIAGSNILITGPAGVTFLVTVKSQSSLVPAASITVVYEISLQSCSTWPAGRYTITLVGGQVKDTPFGNAITPSSVLGVVKVGGVTAGELDPSFVDTGTVPLDIPGTVTNTQPPANDPLAPIPLPPAPIPLPYYPPPVYNPNPNTYAPSWATWDGVLPYVDPETVIHDTTVDSGGKVVVVGESMGNHLWGNPTREYWDRDFYVARYNSDGSLDTYTLPNGTNVDGLGNLKNNPYPAATASDLDDRAFGVVIEPDFLPDGITRNPLAGQIVVAGTHGGLLLGSNGSKVALARYLFTSIGQSRTLDNIMPPPNSPQAPDCFSVTDIQLQAVGNAWKYIVVGSTYDVANGTGQNFTMWRFNSDGFLDTTFGDGGTLVNGVLVNRTGSIVNAGAALPSPFRLSSDDEITGVAIQPTGKIDVIGYSDDTVWNSQSGRVRMIVAQYKADGLPDTTFGVNGFAEISDVRNSSARGNAITVQKDGRIVVAGVFDKSPVLNAADGTPYDTTLMARLLGNGTLDNTFGTAGRLEILDPAQTNAWRASQLAIQSDGKIMVAGEEGSSFALARITADGHMDVKYGDNNGIAILEVLPSGFRETRLGNIGGVGVERVPYSYDLPSIAMGAGLDVDKAYVVGNYAPQANPASLQFGGYTVIRVQGDNTPPTAQAQLSNVEVAGANSYSFYVTYIDNVAVDPTTISAANVVIIAPNGAVLTPLALTAADIVGSGPTDGQGDYRQYVVKYTIVPPGGTWDIGDEGNYVLRLLPNQVADIAGVPVTVPADPGYLELGNFNVLIAAPDTTAPTAAIPGLAMDMTVGGRQHYRFQVIFSDPDGDVIGGHIKVSSLINNSNVITVRGPNNYQQNARYISISDSTDGSPRIVTYEIDAPANQAGAAGYWSSINNGYYTFTLNANQVSDDNTSPNFAQAAQIGQLKIAIVPGQDVYPTATLQPISTLTAKQNALNFTVVYRPSSNVDPAVVIDQASLLANNSVIRVHAIAPAMDMLATFVSISPDPSDPRALDVVYRITPVAGVWDIPSNGTYTVSLMPNQVHDNDGPPNFAQAADLGTFSVQIDRLSAAIDSAANVGTPGATSYSFTVVFTDNSGLLASSILNNNQAIQVSGGSYAQPVFATFQGMSPTADGSTKIIASYTITPPTGAWNSLTDGVYTISVVGGSISNTSGDTITGAALGTFNVTIPQVVNGVLALNGGDGMDTVSVTVSGTNYVVKMNGATGLVPIANVTAIAIQTGAGNDSVYIGPGVMGCYIDGGAGRDVIYGGTGNDTILGGKGADTLYGGGGDDLMYGGAGADLMSGQGGNDSLIGGGGQDQMFGGGGDDAIYAVDGLQDLVAGGAGANTAIYDTIDLVYGIGNPLPVGTVPPVVPPVPAAVFSASQLLGSSVNVLDLVAGSKVL